MDTVKSSRQKALEINLDTRFYGVFAEIGAGQEVARHFFQAGAASQTIAKSISAYDMTYSDHIYGEEESGRYVCGPRIKKMLDREYAQIIERLGGKRGDTCFFSFANTVAIRNFAGTNDPHGWMGIRFQHEQGAAPSEVVVHARMFDNSALQQQDALGTIGVNSIYAAFYKTTNASEFVATLMENVSRARIEIDMVTVSGPVFKHMDNRLIDLELVKQGFTDAILFGKDGCVESVSDSLYRQNLLVARGSYCPTTLVNIDVMKTSLASFCKSNNLAPVDVMAIAEITISQLHSSSGDIDSADFLARLDILAALGIRVLVSSYKQYFKLSSFFSRFKCGNVGIVLGVYNFLQIFDKEYSNSKGGLLESLGRLFRDQTQVYVYPSLDDDGKLVTLKDLEIDASVKHLHQHFVDNKSAQDIKGFDKKILHIYSRKALTLIQNGDANWEQMVPEKVANMIKERKYFGLK
jgi:hypothetical protein